MNDVMNENVGSEPGTVDGRPGSAPPHQPLLLKVGEVAHLLRISRSAVYTLMERGELPYVKIGASRRVERAAVHKLIEASRVGT